MNPAWIPYEFTTTLFFTITGRNGIYRNWIFAKLSQNPRHWMATLGHLIALVFSLFDLRRLDRIWSVVLEQMLVTSVLYWHFPPVKDPKVSPGDRKWPSNKFVFDFVSVKNIDLLLFVLFVFTMFYTNDRNKKSFTEFRCEDIASIY